VFYVELGLRERKRPWGKVMRVEQREVPFKARIKGLKLLMRKAMEPRGMRNETKGI